ncbi:hypothetical protein NQ318_005684 [Aromia moschata]|uniref:PiggyBac transposable element-derived protein domain-containing protein n=1 Tax=Aromia moschata TaxID=1265417 RepID=A0AAV8X3U8_9CUCU|nr:hypothetical protein NQ318_005684 [Aromia moschata]
MREIGGLNDDELRDEPIYNYIAFEKLSPAEMFELFFNDEIINATKLTQSESYARFKNHAAPKITSEAMKCAIGILILSEYNPRPGKRFFWDSGDDMKNLLVSNSMRHNNRIDHKAKVWKMRPFMDLLKERFLHHFIPEEGLDYDESMVKYFGGHGCKQFIRGKPIRFGFKIWCLNGRSGYLINFGIYKANYLWVDNNVVIDQKKWWWSIFTWFLDATINNAWILYRKSGNTITQLNFREILTKYGTVLQGAGRPSTSLSSVTLNRISNDIRYDKVDHLLVPVPNKKRRRCTGEGCSSRIRTMCKNVMLNSA